MKRAAAVAGVLAVLAFVSCGSEEEVKIVLLDTCVRATPLDPKENEDPCGRPPCEGATFREAAAYSEIAVFGGGCPADEDLAAGETDKAIFRGVVKAKEPPPAIGELEKGTYGFAVILRDDACRVMGFGCTAANLESIREVRISVRAWTADNICQPQKGRGCTPPATCVNGSCSSEGGADGGVGDCDFSLLASGALPAALVPTASVTGPGLVPTGNGFLIGFRQQDSAATPPNMVATVASLSDAGTLAPFRNVTLSGCAGLDPSDGIGIEFNPVSGRGLMVTSLPSCAGSGAGAGFIPLDASGAPGVPNLVHNPQFGELTLARVHSLAPGSDGDEWEFIYRAVSPGPPPDPFVELATLEGNGFKAQTLFVQPIAGAEFGMIAATPTLRAVLGRVPSQTAVVLAVVPRNADGGLGGSLTLPDAPWGAVTAWSSRAAAIVPATGSGLTWKAVDLSAKEVGSGQLAGSAFRGGDVTVLRDHLIAVGSTTSAFTLFRVDGASGTLAAAPAHTVAHTSEVGDAPLTGFDGDRISVAAARDRVAVVWLKRQKLTAADASPGGWALFACND